MNRFCYRIGKTPFINVLGRAFERKSIVSVEYTRFNNTLIPGISVVTIFYNDFNKTQKIFEITDEDDNKILSFKKELDDVLNSDN